MEPASTYHFGLMPCSSKPRCTLMQSHWPHALGALKAETTAECMASGRSKCSFLSFQRNDSKACVTTMAAIVSAALIFYQRTCQKLAHFAPQTILLRVKSLWKFGTIVKLPVLFLWLFRPCATAAAFVTTCCLLTALDWPKPGLITNSLYLFSCHPRASLNHPHFVSLKVVHLEGLKQPLKPSGPNPFMVHMPRQSAHSASETAGVNCVNALFLRLVCSRPPPPLVAWDGSD